MWLVTFYCYDKTSWPKQLEEDRVYLGLWLEGDKGPSWQGIILSSARHGCRNMKLTFQPLAWSRESNWKWSGEFRLRKTVSSDILLPIKPNLQNIPQMVLPTGDQAFKSCEGHFHSKPHHLSIQPTSILAGSVTGLIWCKWLEGGCWLLAIGL